MKAIITYDGFEGYKTTEVDFPIVVGVADNIVGTDIKIWDISSIDVKPEQSSFFPPNSDCEEDLPLMTFEIEKQQSYEEFMNETYPNGIFNDGNRITKTGNSFIDSYTEALYKRKNNIREYIPPDSFDASRGDY